MADPAPTTTTTTTTTYDYTSQYNRIATALETIASNSTDIKNYLNDIKTDIDTIATHAATVADKQTTIADKQTTIADKQSVIANKQSAIETYQKRMRELAEGAGIRTITPSELIGLAKMYQVMIEQGKILDDGTPVSDAQQAQARAKFQELGKKVADLLAALGPPKF